MPLPRGWRPSGRLAALVEVPSASSPAEAAGALAAVARAAGAHLVEVVPGVATVLVVAATPADLALLADRVGLTGLPAAAAPAAAPVAAPVAAGPPVGLDVVYDGDDLAAVADAVRATPAEVRALHSGATYTVRCNGFAPGFAYLEGLPAALHLPRRPSPRSRVPAGSVAVADRFSAVYPGPSPGGWHLLGRTSATMFDPRRDPPALLVPGTQVRFRPVDALAAPAPPAVSPPVSGDRIVVVDPGGLVLVQDAGRPGHAAIGVPSSGWLDPAAAGLANRLVGGRGDEAVLELLGRGPTFELRTPSWRAVAAVPATGAPAAVLHVDGRPVGAGPVDVAPGSTVRVEGGGARCYLAVSGGLDAPVVLGSRATDTLSGLGPAPLVAGSEVALGPDRGRRSAVDAVPLPAPAAGPVRLRLHPGPRADWLTDGLDAVTGPMWRVGAQSNRVGVRLEGPTVARRPGELDPEGIVTGALQLPPSGQPVLFLADHPVTGGYPVVGVVDDRDLRLAAALLPGSAVVFVHP